MSAPGTGTGSVPADAGDPAPGNGGPPGSSVRPLLWTTVLFCGLLAVYGALNLAARGRGVAALALAAAGTAVATGAGLRLDRCGGR